MKRTWLLLTLVIGCVLEPNPSPGPMTGVSSDTTSYRPDTTGGGVQDAASVADAGWGADGAASDVMIPMDDATAGADVTEPGCLERPAVCDPVPWSDSLADGYFAWASTTPVVMTVAAGECTAIDRTCQDACDCRWILEGCFFRAASRCQPHVDFDGPGNDAPGCSGLDGCDGIVGPEGTLDCVAGECVVVPPGSDGTDGSDGADGSDGTDGAMDADVIEGDMDVIDSDAAPVDSDAEASTDPGEQG